MIEVADGLLRVEVQPEICVGAGQCALVASAVFDQRDEDGVVVLLHSEPPAGEHDSVREAAGLCPSGAIRLVAR